MIVKYEKLETEQNWFGCSFSVIKPVSS